MATITAQNAGGNWSATGTWIGGVLPDSGVDTVVIPATLAAAVILDDNRTIPPTTIEDEVYGLVQASSVTTTMNGALTIGNGASKDGAFTFGAGSTLALGANNVVVNNAAIRSNSSTSSWAYVTGSGGWTKGAVHSSPKQDNVLRYVSFQNTGAIQFGCGGASGVVATNQADIQYCTFVGTGAITLGIAGWTWYVTTMNFKHCDFRDITGNILFASQSGASAGSMAVEDNTMSFSTIRNFSISNASGVSFTRNIFVGMTINATGGATGGHTMSSNYIEQTGGTYTVQVQDGKEALTISNNYFYTEANNPHTFTATSSGGSGTHQLTGNVFETVFNTDSGNHVIPSTLACDIVNNYQISDRSYLASNVGNITGNGITMTNNTSYYAATFLSESGNYTGTITIKNNIATNNQYNINDNSAGAQTIATCDYNDFVAITTDYNNVTITSGHTHDIALPPMFIDPSRNFATWGKFIAGADGTVAGARNKLLAVNGYNASTKTQSDSPSGVTISGSVNSLTNWVKYGFVPTEMALATSGEAGTYIGAVPPIPGGKAMLPAM
jgi:hypothetical protein